MLLGKLKIQGHSMEPTINEGNLVFVSSLPFLFSKPRIGDVVVLRKENKTLIKRVTRIRNDKFFLAGDNVMDSMNVWANKKDIKGKIVYVITT